MKIEKVGQKDQMVENVIKYYEKLDADIRADHQKKINSAMVELDKMREKSRIRENEAEHKKSLFEQVTLNPDGKLTIKTINTYDITFYRSFSNFRKPVLIELRNFSNELEILYSLQFYIKEKHVEVVLDGAKMGNIKYFINKLTAVGAVIYGEKNETVKRYAQKLWFFLQNECSKQMWIPEQHGWYTDEHGNVAFWKEAKKTWMDAKKLAQ